MKLRPRNARLLALEPFVVATPANRLAFDLHPFGLTLRDEACIDPLRIAAAPFLDLLGRLDALAFGPAGLQMPRWVFLDGAELSGGIVGFAERADALDPTLRAQLGVSDAYPGLVPLSMYAAIPGYEPQTWIGHNLSSLAAHVGDALRGLGSLTKAVALCVFRARWQLGATQWRSRALRVHARMGALEILTAWTPAHTDPATLTYRAIVDDEVLRHLARDPDASVRWPEPEHWIESGDEPALRALQQRIEAGERFVLAGLPKPEPEGQRVPLARLGPRAVGPDADDAPPGRGAS